ncbi:hypothetical protein BUALT_Bualt08G0050700 [Buddleja alternifolia]|uniref:Glutamate receptor n=1 Tax=Buddleja alternifolia TaxID=168488 RepID=A0AAV6X594_9LAMI|nr:hypothetical protein BUALT_Bualt08G0050700 [Buddleja alternifolia]
MHILKFSFFLYLCFILLLFLVESKSSSSSSISESSRPKIKQHPVNISIGVVIDENSRVGKEQRIAMELAIRDFQGHCLNLILHFRDSHGSSSRAAHEAIDLISHIQVHAILGTISLQEASLISELKTTTRSIPIISLSPVASIPRPKLPFYIQMSSPIIYRTQCIAAIVAHFRWRKVILIYEQGGNSFSEDSGLVTHLSNSLQVVDSSIDHHLAFPRISSLFNPKAFIEEELKKLKSKNVNIYVVAQSSLEFAVILFSEAKRLGMMEKGYVWIVSEDVANFLDSVDLSVILSMQGIVGLKTENTKDASEYFREFKFRFRRKYGSRYPAEDENSTPSIYSLRAYDTIRSIAMSFQNLEGKIDSTNLVNRILSSDFDGLSGKINFKNGLLSQKPIFRIVNVIGKSYREVAMWSPKFGFSDDLVELDGKKMRLSSGLTGKLSSIYWPSGEQLVPKGWTMGSFEKPLRIGVPAKGAFNRFVRVTHDPYRNQTLINGFSIEVFEAVVKQLPYDLHYVFVPYYGSYDEMVAEVHNKSLDAAVGDTEIMADRYVYAEFSQPYIESGLVMVVTVKPGLKESKFIALNAFTKRMWIQLAAMSMSTGAIIWLSEYATRNEQFTKNSFFELICSVLWLSVTILSFSHRENINNTASKLVLATWICVVFVVGASFTAVLSTMMTVPRLQPSIVDIEYLRNTNAAVGCNGNSFICRYLINVLHFKPENVWKINSIHEYPKAFEDGGIKAAFFVAPHAKVFLAEYCKGYIISGPSFKLGGFGFVFPKGSPLAIDISEAILKVTQSGLVNTLEKKTNFIFPTALHQPEKQMTSN